MITVAVDANGADLGPSEVARGALAQVADDHDLRVMLFAPAEAIGPVHERVEVVDAPLSIAKEPDPVRAVRGNPQASIVRAWAAVAEGRAQALVSGGSTGSALAAGLFSVKRARGIHRPALAMRVPVPGAPFLFLDVGANAEARPEHLVQFAHMGAAYAREVLGVEHPRVGLLSNGTERGKGTPDVIAAAEALARMDGFVGNVEGFAIGTGEVDVIVTDGFTGNVALKVMEGTSKVLLGAVRSAAMSSVTSRAGGLLLKPALSQLRGELNPERHGGAILLGLRAPAVVPHGSFGGDGFAAAIDLAAHAVRQDVTGRTHAALQAAGVLRRAPEPSAEGATLRE